MENLDATGQSPNEEFLVMNAAKDIATSELLDRMVVGVLGRRRLQRIYIRTGPSEGGKTTIKYHPAEDSPDIPLSILPIRLPVRSRY